MHLQVKHVGKRWDNATRSFNNCLLREALGRLAFKEAAPGEAQLPGGHRFNELGSSLWHDSMVQLFGGTGTLPAYCSREGLLLDAKQPDNWQQAASDWLQTATRLEVSLRQ